MHHTFLKQKSHFLESLSATNALELSSDDVNSYQTII